jgi:hypothetical protein
MTKNTKEYNHNYYENNKEICNNLSKEWKRKNAEKNREYNKKYRESHREYWKDRSSSFHLGNKKKNIEWLLEYLNIEKISCKRCGYNESFGSIDGHHLDSREKGHKADLLCHWFKLIPKSFIKKFLSVKLIFLCRNCHQALHDGVWKIEQLGGKNE